MYLRKLGTILIFGLVAGPAAAMTVTFQFPPAGTEVKFVCRNTAFGGTKPTEFKGSHIFQDPAVEQAQKSQKILTQMEEMGNMTQLRLEWQLPTDMSWRKTLKAPGRTIDYRDRVTDDSGNGSSTYKIGVKRIIRSYREDLVKASKKDSQKPAPRAYVNHTVELIGKESFSYTTDDGPQKTELMHMKAVTFASTVGLKGPVDVTPLILETKYSPELKIVLWTKRSNPDGSTQVCEPLEWKIPGEPVKTGRVE